MTADNNPWRATIESARAMSKASQVLAKGKEDKTSFGEMSDNATPPKCRRLTVGRPSNCIKSITP